MRKSSRPLLNWTVGRALASPDVETRVTAAGAVELATPAAGKPAVAGAGTPPSGTVWPKVAVRSSRLGMAGISGRTSPAATWFTRPASVVLSTPLPSTSAMTTGLTSSQAAKPVSVRNMTR